MGAILRHTQTEYALIHPRFPAHSKAQNYRTLAEAMEDAEAFSAVHGSPALIGRRVTETVTEYSNYCYVSPSGHTLPATGEPVGIPTPPIPSTRMDWGM